MTRMPAAPFVAAAALLIGVLGPVPTASADDDANLGSPLYQLVDTAAQRLLTAEPVAEFKWIDGGPITDPARVQVVLNAVGGQASDQGVDSQYVQQIFQDQIAATEGVEYLRFGQWKLDPASAPSTAPDLATSRTAIDGFNKTMVNEIALHQDSLHGPNCAVDLGDALGAVIAERQFDPMYQQALTFATHSYC